MGSIRQKRKSRSSRSVVKQSNSRKRPLNPTGNVIVAQNWDKTQTLTQNYRRLGLVNRLRQPAGGVEKRGSDVLSVRASKAARQAKRAADRDAGAADPFRIDGVGRGAQSGVCEVRVERDADGQIVRVVRDANPLDDPLNDVEGGEEAYDEADWEAGAVDDTFVPKKATPVVAALERVARQPVARPARHLSAGQREWLQALADHYGTAAPDDTTLAAMARDRRRNPRQHTPAQLARRLAEFRAAGGVPAAA